MKNTKAQAAIEFLLTYGWAILGVIVVVGALSYFGIFNTQKYTQDLCDFGDQFKCEEYIVHEDGWIAFKVRNNFGVPIEINAVEIKSIYGNNLPCPLLVYVEPGSLAELKYCQIDGTFPLNDKVKMNIIITFNREDSDNFHNQTGDIIATVQPSGTCSNRVFDCHDGVDDRLDGCESDLECGGPCETCSNGWMCNVPSDCDGNFCCDGICKSIRCAKQ